MSQLPSGEKSNMRYKELMEEMKKMTGYASKKLSDEEEKSKMIDSIVQDMQPWNQTIYTPRGLGDVFDSSMTQKNSIIVFFGFNGMLSQKYSVVDGTGREEITARLQFAGDKVPYSIKQYDDFMVVVDQMRDTPNMLKEIPFDDALNIIRIGIEKLQVVEFEDAEEDEFDDNCLATCKPGNHNCGK